MAAALSLQPAGSSEPGVSGTVHSTSVTGVPSEGKGKQVQSHAVQHKPFVGLISLALTRAEGLTGFGTPKYPQLPLSEDREPPISAFIKQQQARRHCRLLNTWRR